MTIRWRDIREELPPRGTPILIRGDSGQRAPHNIMLISGYYNDEYRPLSPWLNSQDDCLRDYGITPTHWTPLEEILKP